MTGLYFCLSWMKSRHCTKPIQGGCTGCLLPPHNFGCIRAHTLIVLNTKFLKCVFYELRGKHNPFSLKSNTLGQKQKPVS